MVDAQQEIWDEGLRTMRVMLPKRPVHVKTALERVHEHDVAAAAKTTPFFWTQQKAFKNSMGKGLQTEVISAGSVMVVRTYQDMKSEVIQAASEQWDGFDLDGTLAEGSGKFTPGVIGKPIKSMVRLLKLAIRRGDNPKIFTARIASDKSGIERKAINEWMTENVGQTLPITNVKDENMRRLYDDRAVSVKHNSGQTKWFAIKN